MDWAHLLKFCLLEIETVQRSMQLILCLSFVFGLISADLWGQEAETFPPLQGDVAPADFDTMWAGIDPLAEPLETEAVKEWEQDGVVLRVVRFRIGVFKGKKSLLAGIYGFPKNTAGNLPGLLQIHGGGQFADARAVITNAKRGYATLSIAWAGRINATGYKVDRDIVKLFWADETSDPKYKLTTDWGALDAYHAPCRNSKNSFARLEPAEWTIDKVVSPRNSPWFLAAFAARRGLTFLEQQPEVDKNRLGVYGHSMGGKLTVLTSVDKRVKAAAPSCGGISHRDEPGAMFKNTISDSASLKHISCPIIFLSPANDFHGRIGDLPTAIAEIKSEQWRVTCSPHGSHQDTAEYEVATQLWFDQYLQDRFEFPLTPKTTLEIDKETGVPNFLIQPDASRAFDRIDVFYTQDGLANETPKERNITKNRFWHYASATKTDAGWQASLPVGDVEKPLWAYANVTYPLEKPVLGAGYYYSTYTADKFNLSSLVQIRTPKELQSAGCKATLKPMTLIEDFASGWEKEWFTYKPRQWRRSTHKVFSPLWQAPSKAELVFDVRCEQPNKLVVLLDEHASEVDIPAGDQWQTVRLSPSQFTDQANEPLQSWENLKTLSLSPSEKLKSTDRKNPRVVGQAWNGADPEFRNMRWETDESIQTQGSSE